eukprot:6767183-Prymnesium_polylepis.1
MAPSKITNGALDAYPGWAVMYSASPSASGDRKKLYKHHDTAVIARSVPEIKRIIQLYGHKHPSLCLRRVKMKMAVPDATNVEQDHVSDDALVAVEQNNVFDDAVQTVEYAVPDAVPDVVLDDAEFGVPLLRDSGSRDSILSGVYDSAHMGTFGLVLDEFNAWVANGAPTHFAKVFKFLDQKGIEFRKKMYNFKQSKWYGVPLIILHSSA